MYRVSWGILDENLKRVKKGSKTFDGSVAGNALSLFFKKEDSSSWDWVTLDMDKNG